MKTWTAFPVVKKQYTNHTTDQESKVNTPAHVVYDNIKRSRKLTPRHRDLHDQIRSTCKSLVQESLGGQTALP